MTDESKLEIERVQTGVRIEKRILKVLKAFAEYHDMTLGDVLEGIVPNQALLQTAAAVSVSGSSLLTEAAAAAELGRSTPADERTTFC